jgi:uncharacterized Tic20 family protein
MSMNELKKRKLLSALCHGAIFFSSSVVSIGIPIAILMASDDSIVKLNAKESINFHINYYIYSLIILLLIFAIINFLRLVFLGIVILGIGSFIMPIIAIIQVLGNPDRPYRYPFIFRLV